jgi:hypothetical protein
LALRPRLATRLPFCPVSYECIARRAAHAIGQVANYKELAWTTLANRPDQKRNRTARAQVANPTPVSREGGELGLVRANPRCASTLVHAGLRPGADAPGRAIYNIAL